MANFMVVQNILTVKGLDHMTKKHKAYNKSVSAQIERKARRVVAHAKQPLNYF